MNYRKNKIIKEIIKLISFLIVFVIICVGYYVFVKYPDLMKWYEVAIKTIDSSDRETFRPAEASLIYDKNGNVLGKLMPETESNYKTYDEIPEDICNAMISIEDKTFFDNNGIDKKAILRVIVGYAESDGEELHGASTITQQLCKNIFLTQDVTMERKIKEIMLATEITKKYTKEDIMEFYLNNIYFANAYYGIGAAARGYFSKDLSDLTLGEITFLCAIPNNPSYYDPVKHQENTKKRQKLILDEMVADGYISERESQQAYGETVSLKRDIYVYDDYTCSYAVDCMTRYFMQENGFEFQYDFPSIEYYEEYTKMYEEAYANAISDIYQNGYSIYTSIDPKIQSIVQNAIDEELSFDETKENGVYALQSASTVIDNNNGKVVAIVGGRSQDEIKFGLNRAYQSFRQPGSAIKPIIVYGPALDKDYTSNSFLKNINVKDAISIYERNPNYDMSTLGGGVITLKNAVEQSVNGAAWWLFNDIGIDYGMTYLQDMKFSKIVDKDHVPSASLGGFTYGVNTVEMAGAYACLANGGVFIEPTCIVSIINKYGEECYKEANTYVVYKEKTAEQMTDIMTGVLKYGTASKLNWYNETDVKASAKTGTTNDSKDGWFCGYTKNYTTSVWVGYDTPRQFDTLYGATYPGQIWKVIMIDLNK